MKITQAVLIFMITTLLSIPTTCLAANGVDPATLFGVTVRTIKKHIKINLDCVSESRSIGTVENSELNLIIMSPLSENADAELIFNGCADESRLIGLTHSISKQKALALEKFYDSMFGPLPSITKTATKSWQINGKWIQLIHVFDDRYAVSIEQRPN